MTADTGKPQSDHVAVSRMILFGGADGRTLFILTHHALYAVRT